LSGPGTRPSREPLLTVAGVTKTFGGITALRDAHLELFPGEILALCGENGAGKSTLIKILAGVYPSGSYSGALRVRGSAAALHGVADATRLGIAVIHQELSLVDELTVAENVFLGAEPSRRGLVQWDRLRSRARDLFARYGLSLDPDAPVGSLGVGQRQLVEIAKALGRDAAVLVLDEPTAALTERESEHLLAILRDFRGRGLSAIYVSHRLDEVLAIADRITVMREGAVLGTRATADTSRADLVRDMVGRDVEDLRPERRSGEGAVRLSVQGLAVAREPERKPVLEGVSLEVRSGEVLGIAGLLGSGRTELLLHLFGAFGRRVAGEVRLDGAAYAAESPERALSLGVSLVVEDRKAQGLCLEQSVGFNLSLANLSRTTRFGLVDTDVEAKANGRLFEKARIKAESLDTVVGTLSGGNQQKVLLGRALSTDPKLVLLDEPTRGVDVGARADIYRWIEELLTAGVAVLLVSSDLEELMLVSSRVLVLRDGRAACTLDRGAASRRAILSAALGAADA
jgi:D-xylose transport system ATP-binding protein